MQLVVVRARARPPPTYVGRTRHKQLLVSLAMGRTLFIYCIAVPKMSLVVVTRPPLSAPEFEFVHMMMMMMTKVLVPAPWTGWARHHDGSNPRRVAARTSPCAPHTGATLCARVSSRYFAAADRAGAQSIKRFSADLGNTRDHILYATLEKKRC